MEHRGEDAQRGRGVLFCSAHSVDEGKFWFFKEQPWNELKEKDTWRRTNFVGTTFVFETEGPCAIMGEGREEAQPEQC